jgi:uncharacterized RDD family membrane protein YckC
MFCSVCGAQTQDTDKFCPKCGRVMAAASPVAYAAQPGTSGIVYPAVPYAGPRYGGFWLRVVAYFLDGLIIGIPTGIVIVAIFLGLGGVAYVRTHLPTNMDPDQINANVSQFISAMFGFYALLFVVGIAISWLYYALMESSERQATLGKMALSLKVTDMNGKRLSFGHATGRYFAKLVSGMIPFGIGYVIAGFTERKQALHDFIASTLVVRTD